MIRRALVVRFRLSKHLLNRCEHNRSNLLYALKSVSRAKFRNIYPNFQNKLLRCRIDIVPVSSNPELVDLISTVCVASEFLRLQDLSTLILSYTSVIQSFLAQGYSLDYFFPHLYPACAVCIQAEEAGDL